MPRINEIMCAFGKNVQQERLRQKISQEELAHKANICRTYIGIVERAERNISLQNAKKIADALNITIDELLKDNE